MASSNRKRVRPTDPDFADTVLQWAEEEDEIVLSSNYDSDEDINYEINESEVDCSSDSDADDDTELAGNNPCFGKNGYTWNSIPAPRRKTLAHNIIRFTAGPRNRKGS